MKQDWDNTWRGLIGQIKLPWITVHTRDFKLLHMPNQLDMNRIKLVHMFGWCAPL